MHPDYADVIHAAEAPSGHKARWFDQHGVPRFAPFKPDMQSVYADTAVLAEITCQACGRHFRVGMCHDVEDAMRNLMAMGKDATSEQREAAMHAMPPSATSIGFWHYGDPPRHDCVGDTMNSEPRRILEYWTRAWLNAMPPQGAKPPIKDLLMSDDGGWQRHPEFEIEMTEPWVLHEEKPANPDA